MNKRIVLIDLTKLHGGKCCVAGVCPEEGNQLYRLSSPYVSQEFVNQQGWTVGTELIGTFVRENHKGSAHVEDSRWCACATGRVLSGGELERILRGSCVNSLRDGLGITGKGTPVCDFRPHGRSIVSVSPEFIGLEIVPPYAVGGKPSIRVAFTASGMTLRYIPVTDVRLYHLDGSINYDAVRCFQMHINEFRAGRECLYVRIGITRPFDPKNSNNLQYWTQIDGLHFFSCDTGMYALHQAA